MINRRTTGVLAVAAAILLAAPASQAALAPYSQDFEALSAASPTALSGAGFQVFGTVFNGDSVGSPPYGVVKFSYGPYAAPNGGAAFSAIATGEGGVPQGAQYINVYSDYNCCGPGTTNDGHFDPSLPYDYVQSIVFQQQTIGPADIGTIWTLTFDAKLPALNGCDTAPASDCIAFIKTLDPTAGYATTNLVTFDSQTLSNATWSTHVMQVNLSNPLLSGQILQFGFASTSQKFGNTGVFYDNIVFAVATDADGDGIADVLDNCKAVANTNQRDTNGDGYGNLCDPDLNNDGTVNINDFNRLKARLGIVPVVDVDADLDGNAAVNINDLNRLKSFLGKPPGPSGLHPNCPPTCP